MWHFATQLKSRISKNVQSYHDHLRQNTFKHISICSLTQTFLLRYSSALPQLTPRNGYFVIGSLRAENES